MCGGNHSSEELGGLFIFFDIFTDYLNIEVKGKCWPSGAAGGVEWSLQEYTWNRANNPQIVCPGGSAFLQLLRIILKSDPTDFLLN